MRVQPVRKLHMGCGERLRGVVSWRLLICERRSIRPVADANQNGRRYLRRAADR